MLFLALQNNAGLLCNKATVDNLKKCCHNIKAITTKIAQAEVYKTGPSTDADISGGSENLQKRDIYFVDIHFIHENNLFEETLTNFIDCVKEEDAINRSIHKTINQTWFHKCFDRVRTHLNSVDEPIDNEIFLVDISCTYWGNFVEEGNKTYQIHKELLKDVYKCRENKRLNDTLWWKIKQLLCGGIIKYLNSVAATVQVFFSITDHQVENEIDCIEPAVPCLDLSIIAHDDDNTFVIMQDAIEEGEIEINSIEPAVQHLDLSIIANDEDETSIIECLI